MLHSLEDLTISDQRLVPHFGRPSIALHLEPWKWLMLMLIFLTRRLDWQNLVKELICNIPIVIYLETPRIPFQTLNVWNAINIKIESTENEEKYWVKYSRRYILSTQMHCLLDIAGEGEQSSSSSILN